MDFIIYDPRPGPVTELLEKGFFWNLDEHYETATANQLKSYEPFLEWVLDQTLRFFFLDPLKISKPKILTFLTGL